MTQITSPVSDNFGLLPVGGYDPAYDLEPDFVDPYLHLLDEEMAEADADISTEEMASEFDADEAIREMYSDVPGMLRALSDTIARAKEYRNRR